jgi:hypothetical protein
MAKNNDVFSIIPVPAAAGDIFSDTTKFVGDLPLGKIAVVNADTNKVMDAAAAALANKFYVALAIDTTGDGVKDEILKSAGNFISAKSIQDYDAKSYTATVEQVIDVHSISADCDTEYGLKVEFNLDEKYASSGFNQAVKSFMVKTACCEGCTTCGTGNCAELVRLLMADINADEDALVVASAFANVGGATVSVITSAIGVWDITLDTTSFAVDLVAADTKITAAAKMAAAINASDVFSAKSDGVDTVKITMKGAAFAGAKTVSSSFTGSGTLTIGDDDLQTTAITDLTDAATGFKFIYGDGCPSLRLTSVTQAVNSFCSVNPKYYKQRTPIMIVSKVAETGFDCVGTIVTSTAPVLREGAGYDLAQIEYEVGGFIGKPGPYRTGDLLGIAFSDFLSVVSKTTNYHMVDLTYDVQSNGGWLDYNNHFNTKFVVACTTEAAGQAFLDILDAAVCQDTGAAGNGFTALNAEVGGYSC